MNLNIDLSTPKRKTVPNVYNTINSESRVAIIGEAPGEEEENVGMPFVGASGQLLDRMLTQAGIHRGSCLVANVCQYRPPRNNINAFDWHGREIQEGLDQLAQDITSYNPNICLLLGSTALRAGGWGKDYKINEWRGSLMQCQDSGSPLFGRKCLPTFHPAAVLRQWSWMPLMLFDFFRVKDESTKPELVLPSRHYDVDLNVDQMIDRLTEYRLARKPVALDIEGYPYNISCVSFANSPGNAFIVPLHGMTDGSLRRVLRAMSELLWDTNVPKILQNSLYDNLALSLTYSMPIRNVVDDTMLAGWEINPEIPKSLGTLASIFTREPFYKYMRKVDDVRTHHIYCCKDSAVTHEIAGATKKYLTGSAGEHYRFNVDLLRPFLYMELRGIKFDHERAKELRAENEVKLRQIASRLKQRAGLENPASPQQCCKALYDVLNFPPQHPKKTVGYGLDRTKRTSDVNALLKLCGKFDDPFLTDLLRWRKIEKTNQALAMKTDDDHRVRCSYSAVGTETGRVSSSSQSRVNKDHKVGTNMQTITKPLRKLFIADPGMLFFQADLAGADGWTVAAHALDLGDSTMYEDYLFGLKPAKIIVLLDQIGHEVNSWSRNKLKDECCGISEEGPMGSDYFAAKVIQHGTSYKMGARTMAGNITLQSYKKKGSPIYVPELRCKVIQELFFTRYPGIRRWHNKVGHLFRSTRGYPTITSANGHTRTFFGRATDDATIRAALSQEPQANTTYATNLALLNLWNDPDNRRPDGSLIIEPLHQVHDAVCGQFPEDRVDWALGKIRHYFNNPMTIAGTELVIPFDGGYGRSWGELTNEFS